MEGGVLNSKNDYLQTRVMHLVTLASGLGYHPAKMRESRAWTVTEILGRHLRSQIRQTGSPIGSRMK